MTDSSRSERETEPMWMVARTSAFATHWSDAPNTYGPFASREEAEAFVANAGGGWVYDWHKEPELQHL